MKKLLVCFSVIAITLSSCRKDEETPTTTPVDITTQNSYDDQAIKKFLEENYLDTKGNIKTFSATDTSDDNYPKLSSYNPVTLPSGVVYIVTPNAQPSPGTTIAADDAISIMHNTVTYLASKDATSGVVSFVSGYPFRNTIGGTGVPEFDPAYYYVKQSALDKYNSDFKTTKDRSFFQIEGLREALPYFKAFNKPDSDGYYLQGIILVPSRAAFARDPYYINYSNISLNDRCFIFNFQIYRTTPRSVAGN